MTGAFARWRGRAIDISKRRGQRRLGLADLWRDPLNVLALGFGSGLAPAAPGTFGTVVALPIFWGLSVLPLPAYLLCVAGMSVAGVWICERANRSLGVDDHPGVVWDEICGYLLAMTAVPATWPWMLAGFVIFRALDIIKPWPIRLAERRVGGGAGVMLDDLIAGAIALLGLHVLLQVTG